MFWADKLLENRSGRQIVNDSWTPSGIVHMGSLKGPVIHDILFKILKEKKTDVKFIYGFDDADPIDGLPPDLKKTHSKYLGVPISIAPAPNGKGSFGDYFGSKIKKLLDILGIDAEFYKTSILYKEGKFNDAIIYILDHAQEIRDVYGKIYKKVISKNWYPLQVICPNCGKLSTTRVTSWDGKEVSFSCERDLVEWAQGCGENGTLSPLNGASKMPYKVEWAAKWWTFGITVEGAGKDHASAGGTYDVATQIIEKVFKKEPPLKFGYEFFLIGGKKMSSSKGVGLTGEELLEVLTPQVARFLMIKTRPEQAVEFDPRSPDIIPRLYDDYQIAANSKDDFNRAFMLSQTGGTEKVPELRFWSLAQWIQFPDMDDKIRNEGIQNWAPYAKKWIENYAPDDIKFSIQENIPEQAKGLTQKQKEFLSKKLLPEIDNAKDPDEYQRNIYEWAKEFGLSSAEAFEAIYKSLIGKGYGPKAAWLIFKHKDTAKKRFHEIAA